MVVRDDDVTGSNKLKFSQILTHGDIVIIDDKYYYSSKLFSRDLITYKKSLVSLNNTKKLSFFLIV
jgi:hypothetical protein